MNMSNRIFFLLYISLTSLYSANQDDILVMQKLTNQSEQIEGMKSIVDGMNDKIREITEENIALKEDAERNKELLFELRERIDKINQNYASKEDVNKAFKQSIATSENTKSTKESTKDSKTKEEYYKEAIFLFKEKKYKYAKVNFQKSAVAKYNEALSFYYLGECAYYTKSYNEAIVYYKKSAKINDKATYMDALLLHTAISLENTKEFKQAKLFYDMVVDKYPTSSSATIAEKKLLTLKAS